MTKENPEIFDELINKWQKDTCNELLDYILPNLKEEMGAFLKQILDKLIKKGKQISIPTNIVREMKISAQIKILEHLGKGIIPQTKKKVRKKRSHNERRF